MEQKDDVAEPVKRNTVVFYLDDSEHCDVGVYGATEMKTPNIDKPARNGVMFTDGHTC